MSSQLPRIRYNPDGTALNADFEQAIRDNGLLDFDAMMGLATGELSKGRMAALLEQLSKPWRDDD